MLLDVYPAIVFHTIHVMFVIKAVNKKHMMN